MSVIKSLFAEIVDYAGLFPPAGLPLPTVVANYENYLAGDHRWMLARLILPVSRLEEFEQQDVFNHSEHRWKISGLIPSVDAEDNGFEVAVDAIAKFNARHAASKRAVIDTVEVKTPTIELVSETIKRLPESLNGFLEIPHRDDPADFVRTIQQAGANNAFAKIRTGGMTQDAIPTPFQVARFIRCCADHNVGFKATAGLHHPLNGEYRLTYKPNPDIGTMFGFVNVFIAATFAFNSKISAKQLEEILIEQSPAAFTFSEQSIRFNCNVIPSQDIQQTRKLHAISFGSCSFDEPTSELEQLGWTSKQTA